MKFNRINSVLIMLFGLVLIFFGIYREEASVVFEKAIRICLECIGVG